MALKDVKQYYYKTLAQLIAAKADLADLEEAVKAGNITEERFTDIKNEIADMQINTDRLAYILFLFELPNRAKKKPKYLKANKVLSQEFIERAATDESVINENDSALNFVRQEVKKIKEENK